MLIRQILCSLGLGRSFYNVIFVSIEHQIHILDHSVSMTYLNIFSVVHPSTMLTKVLWSDLCDTSSWSFSFKTWFCVSVSISPSLLNIDGETGANSCFKTVSNAVCPVARNLIMQTYATSASYTLISPAFIPFLPDNIFTLTTATTIPWKPVDSFLQKYFNCNIPKDTASSTLTFLSQLILPEATCTSSGGWLAVSNLVINWSKIFHIFSWSWLSVMLRVAISFLWSFSRSFCLSCMFSRSCKLTDSTCN